MLQKSRNHIRFGIEEEFFILPNKRLELTLENSSEEVFEEQIEIKTNIHSAPVELFRELQKNRKILKDQLNGSEMIGMGTHPGKKFTQFKFLCNSKNEYLKRELGFALEMLVTCGCHIHFSIGDISSSLYVLNQLRKHIPFLIAISGNSSSYLGHETNYASFRNHLFSSIPRSGIPPHIDDLESFNNSFFSDANPAVSSKNWYDIKFNEVHSTVEFRMFDANDDLGAVKMFFSFAYLLIHLELYSVKDSKPPDYILNENRWRATRFGLNAQLIIGDSVQSVLDYGLKLIEENIEIIEQLGIVEDIFYFKTNLPWEKVH